MDPTAFFNLGFNLGFAIAAGELPALVGIVVLVVLSAVAWSRLFRKAGRPWWQALIPVYGQIATFSMIGCLWLLLATLGVGALLSVVTFVPAIAVTMWGQVLQVLLLVAAFVLYCIFCLKLAEAYGKDGEFAVGLVLLLPVFVMVLAFGRAEYEYVAEERKSSLAAA